MLFVGQYVRGSCVTPLRMCSRRGGAWPCTPTGSLSRTSPNRKPVRYSRRRPETYCRCTTPANRFHCHRAAGVQRDPGFAE